MTLLGTYAWRPAITQGNQSFCSLPGSLAFRGGTVSFFIMPLAAFKRTVVLDLSDVPTSVPRAELVTAIKGKFTPFVIESIQFVPVKLVEITFADPECKGIVEGFDFVTLGGAKCKVMYAGPRAQNVMLYHYRSEESNDRLLTFFSSYRIVSCTPSRKCMPMTLT